MKPGAGSGTAGRASWSTQVSSHFSSSWPHVMTVRAATGRWNVPVGFSLPQEGDWGIVCTLKNDTCHRAQKPERGLAYMVFKFCFCFRHHHSNKLLPGIELRSTVFLGKVGVGLGADCSPLVLLPLFMVLRGLLGTLGICRAEMKSPASEDRIQRKRAPAGLGPSTESMKTNRKKQRFAHAGAGWRTVA